MSSAINMAPSAETLPVRSLAPESSGAEIIVRVLERRGVGVVAGIPGGALLPLYEALARCTRIRHVLARHEQAAGFIAQGMARITRRAGVCFATSGPGVTNILTAIADAKLDSIPLVCIAGQVPKHLIGTDAFQEVATIDLARPITKAAFFAESAHDLPAILAEAFHVAENGRPGPVLIDVPKDVQTQTVHYKAPLSFPQARLPKNDSLYAVAGAMIARAQRPVLYIGGGVVKSRAEELVRRFAESHSIPVATTLMALGTLRYDHPLNLGMLGMHGEHATHQVIDRADVLIAIGARFDDRATGKPDGFAPHAQIIHIDIDPREFGKIKKPTVAIHADAWNALTQLLTSTPMRERSKWRDELAVLRREFPTRPFEANHPRALIRKIGAIVGADAIVTTDVGQHQMWVAQAYPFARADRWLTSGGLGTMGFGLPAAIGAAIAEPEANVLCFTGDGSLLMNIQEFATLAELGVAVKIILLDNASLGLVRQQQELFYQRRYSAAHFETPSDFVAIARAFGIEAYDVGDVNDADLEALLRKTGPLLLRARIGPHNVSPMVRPGAANVDAMDC